MLSKVYGLMCVKAVTIDYMSNPRKSFAGLVFTKVLFSHQLDIIYLLSSE